MGIYFFLKNRFYLYRDGDLDASFYYDMYSLVNNIILFIEKQIENPIFYEIMRNCAASENRNSSEIFYLESWLKSKDYIEELTKEIYGLISKMVDNEISKQENGEQYLIAFHEKCRLKARIPIALAERQEFEADYQETVAGLRARSSRHAKGVFEMLADILELNSSVEKELEEIPQEISKQEKILATCAQNNPELQRLQNLPFETLEDKLVCLCILTKTQQRFDEVVKLICDSIRQKYGFPAELLKVELPPAFNPNSVPLKTDADEKAAELLKKENAARLEMQAAQKEGVMEGEVDHLPIQVEGRPPSPIPVSNSAAIILNNLQPVRPEGQSNQVLADSKNTLVSSSLSLPVHYPFILAPAASPHQPEVEELNAAPQQLNPNGEGQPPGEEQSPGVEATPAKVLVVL